MSGSFCPVREGHAPATIGIAEVSKNRTKMDTGIAGTTIGIARMSKCIDTVSNFGTRKGEWNVTPSLELKVPSSKVT